MNSYERIYNLLVEAEKAKKPKTDEGPAMRDVEAFNSALLTGGAYKPGETKRAQAAIKAGTKARQSPAARRHKGRGMGRKTR